MSTDYKAQKESCASRSVDILFLCFCFCSQNVSSGIGLGSDSSLGALSVTKSPMILHADSEDSDQTGWMTRLTWVFAGRTDHFVGFVMRRPICNLSESNERARFGVLL